MEKIEIDINLRELEKEKFTKEHIQFLAINLFKKELKKKNIEENLAKDYELVDIRGTDGFSQKLTFVFRKK